MRLIAILLLLVPLCALGQCPDAKANEYKSKAQQYGDQSYTILAQYYYFKCQCENGLANRTPQQVNSLVSTYNNLKNNHVAGSSNGFTMPGAHQTEYVNIYPVSSCSQSADQGNNQSESGSAEEEAEAEADMNYINAVSSATMSSLNGDYQAAALQYTNMALDGFTTGDSRNALVGTTGALLSVWQQSMKQNRERQMQREAFLQQAEAYRSEVKGIMAKRESFMERPKLKSTINKDGSDFQPLYMYCAYVDKGYNQFTENIVFPDLMNISFDEQATVYFSPVFAFFPQSNGEYPLIGDIQQKILKKQFGSNSENYHIAFFNWEDSVDDVVASLQQNINSAVSNHYFARAVPSESNELVFLTPKNNGARSVDYWTGDKVESKKSSQEIDYWGVESEKNQGPIQTPAKKTEVDYWDN